MKEQGTAQYGITKFMDYTRNDLKYKFFVYLVYTMHLKPESSLQFPNTKNISHLDS